MQLLTKAIEQRFKAVGSQDSKGGSALVIHDSYCKLASVLKKAEGKVTP